MYIRLNIPSRSQLHWLYDNDLHLWTSYYYLYAEAWDFIVFTFSTFNPSHINHYTHYCLCIAIFTDITNYFGATYVTNYVLRSCDTYIHSSVDRFDRWAHWDKAMWIMRWKRKTSILMGIIILLRKQHD